MHRSNGRLRSGLLTLSFLLGLALFVFPVHAALRNLTIGETQYAEVANLTLKKDVGTFTFQNGSLLLPPAWDPGLKVNCSFNFDSVESVNRKMMEVKGSLSVSEP